MGASPVGHTQFHLLFRQEIRPGKSMFARPLSYAHYATGVGQVFTEPGCAPGRSGDVKHVRQAGF